MEIAESSGTAGPDAQLTAHHDGAAGPWPSTTAMAITEQDLRTLGPIAPGETAPRPGQDEPSRPRVRQALLAGIVLLVPMVAVVVARLGRDAISSDSVAQQSIVLTWLHVGHHRTYLPPDTWALKLPLYALVERLPLAPASRLLVESVTVDVAAFSLLGLGAWSLAGLLGVRRRWIDVVLPLIWVGTLGGGNGQYLAVMPNSRNVELGLSLCVIALAGRYLSRRGVRRVPRGEPRATRAPVARRTRGAAVGVGAALLLGLLWVDDPYFAYLVGAPLAAGCVLWFVVRRRDPRLLWLCALLTMSLLTIPVLHRLLSAAGVQIVPDGTGVTLRPRDLIGRLPVIWPALSAQVGLSEHGPGAGAAHAAAFAALVILAAAVAAAGYLAWCGWRARSLVLTFVALHWPIVVVGILVDSSVYDYHAGRYLVLAVVDLAVSIGVAVAALRPSRPRLATVVSGALVVAVAANCAAVLVEASAGQGETAVQQQTLALLRGTGAAKGFGEFWTADLYTQLSGGDLMVSDVACANGQLHLRDWLTDSARVDRPAARTFVLWEPTASDLKGCSLPGIERQLGHPSTLTPAPGGATVLTFDTDITARLDPGS